MHFNIKDTILKKSPPKKVTFCHKKSFVESFESLSFQWPNFYITSHCFYIFKFQCEKNLGFLNLRTPMTPMKIWIRGAKSWARNHIVYVSVLTDDASVLLSLPSLSTLNTLVSLGGGWTVWCEFWRKRGQERAFNVSRWRAARPLCVFLASPTGNWRGLAGIPSEHGHIPELCSSPPSGLGRRLACS